eukprot:SAG11_NODE_3519_length_2396_cov_2.077057_2_plen_77_part_00
MISHTSSTNLLVVLNLVLTRLYHQVQGARVECTAVPRYLARYLCILGTRGRKKCLQKTQLPQRFLNAHQRLVHVAS